MKTVNYWIISKSLDILTTIIVAGSDFEMEANPLLRSLLKNFGLVSLFWVLILSSLVVYLIIKRFSSSKIVIGAVKFGVMVNFLAVSINLFGLLLFYMVIFRLIS